MLVVDGTVVPIANAAKVPAELYGLKVQVTGEMKGEAIEIASIEAAK